MGVSDYFSDEEIKTLDKCITYASGRRMIVSKITREHEHNWQTVETPHRVCREMLGLIPEDAENFVIFFALEFLEVLVKELEFDGGRVVFIADNELEANVATVLYGVKSVVYSKQEVSGIAIKELLEDTGMKFGKVAVVGNPPYQQQSEAQKNRKTEGGKQQAKPIYHLFVESVIDYINPNYFSFIIPSRWMVGGMGLGSFRERMMNDRRIKKIVHFSGTREIFENVAIAGGVNYFLWQKNYNGECEFVNDGDSIKRNLNDYDIILQDNKAISILYKVQDNCSKFINQRTIVNKPFGLPTNYSSWTNSGTKCISKERKVRFVVSDFTDKHGILNKWKVCTNQSTVEGASFIGKEKAFFSRNGIFIIEPGTICTETYIVINVFDTKCEAENFVAYMKTKFFRFMLGLRVVTQHINKEKFAWVPDLEDYSKPWTDEELYRKFGLTENDIRYVESKIKPIV